MSSRSISGELSRKIIIAVAILVLGGVFGLIEFSGRIIKEYTEKNAKSSLNTLTASVEGQLKEVESLTASINWLLLDHLDNPEYMRAINEKLVTANDLVVGAAIAFVPDFYKNRSKYYSLGSCINPDTKEILSVERDDHGEAEWYVNTIENGKGTWSEPYKSPYAGWVTRYCEPMYDVEGSVIAVMTLEVSVKSLSARLSMQHFYDSAYSVILTNEATVLCHPVDTLIGMNMRAIAYNLNETNFLESVEAMTRGESGSGGIKRTGSVAIFGPLYNGWSISIIGSFWEIFGGTLKFQLLLLLFAIMDLILLYIVTKAIIGRTLMPITEVTYLAKNVAKGNFKADVPHVEGHTEMFHLHEAIRGMLHSINDYIAQLKTTTAANERFESELSIASDIQKQMLRTDFINDDEVDLYATLKPAKEVGGDMYDFLRVDRTIYFAVGDVSGKGVPAALYMAISRSLFHYVSGMSLSTAGVASCINSSFCSGNDTNMFITMFIGRFDLDTRELVFCNAGHNPIIVIDPKGNATYLHAKSNMAAGVFDEFPYEKESIHIEEGSRLLIYTDGVSEAENVVKDQYGEDRLIEFAGSQDVNISSEEFVENLYKSIKEFTKENDQNDDITIMSVKL